jgi:hypothetical protein
MIGSAPCQCGYYHYEVPLTGERQPDGEGGWNWEVESGFACSDCGEILSWLHEPAPESLIFSTAALAQSLEALHAEG